MPDLSDKFCYLNTAKIFDHSNTSITTSGNGAIIKVGDDANRCPYVVKDSEFYYTYFGTDTGNDPGWG